MKKYVLFASVFFVLILLTPLISGSGQNTGKTEFRPMGIDTENPRDFLPDSTYNKYKGVISADMASGDAAHELLVDFGSKGVWWLGGKTGSWVKVTGDNPATMMPIEIDGDPAIEVVLDFGTKGLWLFDYSFKVNWIRLTGDNPEGMVASDDDNDGIQELSVDFGTKGLWRYDFTNGWRKRTNDNPSYGFRTDFWTPGYEETMWNFPGIGVWNVYGGTYNSWLKLTSNQMSDDGASAELGIGDAAEEFVADFSEKGTWGYDGSAWTKLTNADPWEVVPVRFVGNVDYELLVKFDEYVVPGLWMWNTNNGEFSGTTWTKLTNDIPSHDEGGCVPWDPNGVTETSGDEEVAIDFRTKGLWLYNYTAITKWTKLTNDSPRFMVPSDLDGDGVDNYLICNFGTKGLWYYSGKTGIWTRLTGDSPDDNLMGY